MFERVRRTFHLAWSMGQPWYPFGVRRLWNRVSLNWTPQDLWVGVYWKWAGPASRRWYICLVPTVVIVVWERR